MASAALPSAPRQSQQIATIYGPAQSISKAITLLVNFIISGKPTAEEIKAILVYKPENNTLYSLGALFDIFVQQWQQNLDHKLPQGFIIAVSPSVHLAQAFGSEGLGFINRIQIAALAYVMKGGSFPHFKALAFDDTNDDVVMSHCQFAVGLKSSIKVISQKDILGSSFSLPDNLKGAALVMNSGFVVNVIENPAASFAHHRKVGKAHK